MKFLDKLINIHKENYVGLSGMTDEFFCVYINKLQKEEKRNILILTSSLYEANKIYNSLRKYCINTFLFPMDDFITSESIAISPELKSTRLNTLNNLVDNFNGVVICHLESYLRYLPTKEKLLSSKLNLSIGDNFDRAKLIQTLIDIGYTREKIVTNTGEIGVRGFVIDVFPINCDTPIRIEFFDDEIESIRSFDPVSQKSFNNLNKITIFPNTEFLTDSTINEFDKRKQKYYKEYVTQVSSIKDYMGDYILVVKDHLQIKASYNKLYEDIVEYKKSKDNNYNGFYMNELDQFNNDSILYYDTLNSLFEGIKLDKIYNFDVKKSPQFYENIDAINAYIEKELLKQKTIIICLKDYQIKSFIQYIKHFYVITNENEIYENKLNIISGEMSEGFIYGNYIFLTQKELFNKNNDIKYKMSYKYSTKIKNINSLEIGDYVVHSVHGIGIYNGIKTLSKAGLKKDYLEILYAGTDKIYIPVEKIELIGKFTGKEGVLPKINKLGGTEWQKTKLRVRDKVHNIAKELIELYAKRKLKKGFAFSQDNELQTMFESEFEYTETPDQLRAIEQIKRDMESEEPMDRLLCGDVGYGKTEIAFRAMLKAVCDSKQVLYLCPTTILSIQQYKNAKARFANFPVKIEIINRFTPTKKVKQIISELTEGNIDILFGTHRLLSNDIKPKNLGLLVVDEEQRFGVVHKEKIKEYKENIDVLTLTATPIPRTLQMSLVGLRSLSLIETPPVDRYPIQTYVIEENKALIRDAIYKEMSRDGQVFILYNNVSKIQQKVDEICQLVPEARVTYAHGQLNKEEIELKMAEFIDHKYDVLVCTTIIETGIDINNVNTLIIYDADHFGLSQLYQIRGRVGRSNKIAYAYLMYKKNKILNDTALKRLKAISEFTELGSGFAIASRDLAIRGAGDILGSEQAGFIDSVGIDLYLKILNEEVNRLQGNTEETEEKESSKNLIEVETHISNNYVEEEELKIEIHKLINTVDSYEKLVKVKEEIEDRFGKVNETLLVYMYEEWFESLAKLHNIKRVVQLQNKIDLMLGKDLVDKIDCELLFLDAISITRNFSFKYKNNELIISLEIRNLEKHYIYYLTSLLSSIKYL